MSNLAKAIALASKEFENKTDRGGNPYILHCLYVMDKVKHLGEQAMIVGVLHDVLEDTNISEKDLIELGYKYDTVRILDNVTHWEGEDYMHYIKRAASHPISKAVKKADLEHNSKIFRMKGLRQKDMDRLQKYFTAYQYLSE